MKNLYIIIIAVFGLISCEKIFMKPNPETSRMAIFDEYAKLVKEKYAMLEFKGVDIDHLRDSIRATITEEIADTTLMNKLGVITSRLRDGHSNLIAFEKDQVYGFAYNLNFGYDVALDNSVLENVYYPNLTVVENPASQIEVAGKYKYVYGRMSADTDIAYLRVPSFGADIEDAELETIFATFSGAKGLIIDVRGNGGGDPTTATKMAAYFMSETTYTGFERFKTGPGENDFVDSPSNVTPAESDHRFTEDVVVLTDRGVYSATTTLCYNLDPLPQVTFLGQRTGGGSGSVADGFLANGWAWSLSVSEFIGYQNQHLDDGFEPDISVDLDVDDTSKDELIEAAIQELQ